MQFRPGIIGLVLCIVLQKQEIIFILLFWGGITQHIKRIVQCVFKHQICHMCCVKGNVIKMEVRKINDFGDANMVV